MTQEEIIEGNKLIAEFIGSKYINKPFKMKDINGKEYMQDFWHWSKPEKG